MEMAGERRLSDAAIFGRCTDGELQDDRQLRQLSELVKNAKMIFAFFMPADGSSGIKVADELKRQGHETIFVPREQEDVNAFLNDVALSSEEKKVVLAYTVADFGALWNVFYNLKVVYSNPDDPGELKYAVYKGYEPLRPVQRIDFGVVDTVAPMFSVLIPVRNNAECLRYCLKTLMEQTCMDFEVIVSDNSSDGNDEVFKLVTELAWEKITYVRADKYLNLMNSFEFAHQYSRGEYVLSLGADDGLLFHGIAALKMLVEQSESPIDAMRFDYMFYGWGNAVVAKFRDFIRLPRSIVKEKTPPKAVGFSTRELLERYAGYDMDFYDIPNGYIYSILSKRVINTLKSKVGRLFPDLSQDTFTGCHICSLLDEVHATLFPISINGTSGLSVGANTSNDADSPKAQHISGKNAKSVFDNNDANILEEFSEGGCCLFVSDKVVNAQNIIKTVEKKLLPKEWIDKLNWKKYFELCLSYIYDDDDDEHFRVKLEDIREKVEMRADPELSKWFLSEYYHNESFRGSPAPPSKPFTKGLLPSGVLYLNGLDFDVHTSYDAAVFFEKIANFKEGYTYPPS